MTTYKKWAMSIGAYLVVFVAFNLFMWKAFTEDLLTNNRFHNGGLDRLGYVVGSKHYRNAESTLTRKASENWEYPGGPVDVLTIGDSFSNVKNNGRDPLYQDWMATLYGYSVLNVQPLQGHDAFATLVVLLNSGYLDRVRPRVIVLQIVERNCVEYLSAARDFSATRPLADILAYFRITKFKEDLPAVSFINTGNFMVIRNWILYRYSDNAFGSAVYVKDLDRPLFTVRNDRRLLFYQDDILHIGNATPRAVQRLNENLNTLASLLHQRGIKLCFLPAADKYNVYSEFIVDNPYPRSVLFELLRPLPKKYTVVDTKMLLKAEVERGEKDIYYADDSHWSWKAVKKIAEHMDFR
jgi:hypothetical protein